MIQTAYGLKKNAGLGMAEAETRVLERLADQGFGILTEIDVAAPLLEKLGLAHGPYRILGACNPHLAAKGLDREDDVGLLLSCNVVLYEDGNGTIIAALDPKTMVEPTGYPALDHVAVEARQRPELVIDGIGKENDDA